MKPLELEMAQRGQITIPKSLRDRYGWDAGQQFSVIDLDGIILFSPKESRINTLANQLRDDLLTAGATLEEMLAELRRLRENEA